MYEYLELMNTIVKYASPFFTIVPVIFSLACVYIAERRGGILWIWFILGLLFGPLAFVIALTAGSNCPHCQSKIPKDAKVCRYCSNNTGF
ncbi:MAG: hypothetical protein H3C35_02730 [Bacteroidetes bacterium]|nr:hypothetical protein [Bacteroidota bacterium]